MNKNRPDATNGVQPVPPVSDETAVQTALDADPQSATVISARDRAFAAMFRPDEQVWQLEAVYKPAGVVWQMDFLRQNRLGRWMQQRFHYDVATGVIYFMGETPVNDTELRRLRRSGTRIIPKKQT